MASYKIRAYTSWGDDEPHHEKIEKTLTATSVQLTGDLTGILAHCTFADLMCGMEDGDLNAILIERVPREVAVDAGIEGERLERED